MRLPLALALSALPLAACRTDDALQKQHESITSWSATMALATAEHRSGAITTVYFRQLDAASRRAEADATQSLTTAGPSAPGARELRAAIDSLNGAIRAADAEHAR